MKQEIPNLAKMTGQEKRGTLKPVSPSPPRSTDQSKIDQELLTQMDCMLPDERKHLLKLLKLGSITLCGNVKVFRTNLEAAVTVGEIHEGSAKYAGDLFQAIIQENNQNHEQQ